MAQMLIILKRDPASGKQNVIVKLDSDPDSLPIEHEQLHKKLIEKLLGKGLNPEDLGEIVIERESPTEAKIEQTPNEPERQKTGQKG